MIPLTNALKKMLSGLAHADAGEYLSSRDKHEYLKNLDYNVVKTTDPAPVLSEKAVKTNVRRHIAMYLGSELPPAMMDYVIETCSSLDHDLSVVTFESSRVYQALMAPYADRLAEKKISMKTARLSGDPIEGLARYLRGHPEIAFLACKDSGYLGRSYMSGSQLKHALPVPVVVVVTEPAATGSQPADKADQESKTSAA